MQATRRIIHIDMDCFYAAVEMREHPELDGRPIAVGGASGRGVLTTCNYAAREYGVRSAMPVFKARELCPHLVILPVRFELYRAASKQIRNIFHCYTELVEPLSLDEAYLDVSHLKRRGAEIAEEIRAAIFTETQLTASAGIGPNKLIAKVASDWNKPNGQCVVSPSHVANFMQTLPVRRIPGVGPKSAARLAEVGVETCAQLQEHSKNALASEFGSFGLELYKLCRGIDERPVLPNRIRKSLSNEHTFTKNIETLEDCEDALRRQHGEMLDDLRNTAADRQIAKVVVKLKFSDFRRTTAEVSSRQPELKSYLKLLREAWGRSGEPVRLLGIGVRFAETQDGPEQLELGL
ncbi:MULTISPECIES: DNA polymerase IV [unclassified Lentimonas]|uniref:DNA polymerase IV n=1 Tax=unclassified Lentimonas TaxID=2630993 RepID=UPI001389698C|nr:MULTISPECIES: DNA polymerase IV [unclassified Lentimonas]